MKQISGSTFYFKKLFPTFWFGFTLLFILVSLYIGNKENEPVFASVIFIVGPLFMAALGYFIFKKLAWDLADRVYDHGDYLEFHRGGKIQRVPIDEIINISYSHMSSPERVVIRARNIGPIGKELVFMPPMRLMPLSRSPLVDELIERVDRARKK